LAYDNICKYLAEEYPSEFFQWVLGKEPQDIQVLKSELSAEPIQADALSLLQSTNQILHLEFQTLPQSDPPLPCLDAVAHGGNPQDRAASLSDVGLLGQITSQIPMSD